MPFRRPAVLLTAFASLPFVVLACSAPAPADGDEGSGGTTGSGGGLVGSSGGSASGGGAATGGTGAATGGSTSGGCDGATLCDDFEGGMDAAWAIQPDSQPAPTVDAAKGANGSTSSLVVEGTSQQSFVTLAVPAQDFWVRAFVNFEKSTDEMTGHGWFIVGADNVTSGGGAQMRMGSSGNHGDGNEIDFNVYGGGCTGEKTQFSCGGGDGLSGWTNKPYPMVKFAKDTWYCVEAHFNGPGDEFEYFIDKEEVPGLHVTAETMCANWSPTYTHIKIGAGANSNLGKIWYDDVGISATRIGCP